MKRRVADGGSREFSILIFCSYGSYGGGFLCAISDFLHARLEWAGGGDGVVRGFEMDAFLFG